MLVDTIYGPMVAYVLDKRVTDETKPSDTMPGIIERVEATEYWLGGECVHRSAHVTLTHAPAGADTGSF